MTIGLLGKNSKNQQLLVDESLFLGKTVTDQN